MSLKLQANGSLHDYIDRFQGLSILWREINTTVQAGDNLVTQMVDQIEYPLFTGTYESIRNWDILKKTFCDAGATLRGHEISKNAGQTKKNIGIEVNGLLMGNSSRKRRETGKTKAIRGFKLGGQEESRPSEHIPLKVWRMLTPEARTIIKEGGEGKIGVVKESGVKENMHGGGNFPHITRNLGPSCYALL